MREVRAFHAVGQAKQQYRFVTIPGRIEATHFVESLTFVTFKLQVSSAVAAQPKLDPGLMSVDASDHTSESNLTMLDFESDQTGSKIEQYMRKLTTHFIGAEPSLFVRCTLEFCLKMSASARVSANDHQHP